MADNPTVGNATGQGQDIVVATDDDGTAHHPYVKLEWGANNTQTKVDTGVSALPIQDGGNTITVDGTVAATQSGTWNVGTVTSITNVVHIDDNASTISIDDGGGIITVDGSVTANAGTNLNTSALALETGGNLAAAAASLALLDNAIAGNELQVDVVTMPTTTVTGTVTVTDGSGSLTVDGTVTANLAAGTNNIGDVDVLTMPARKLSLGGYTASIASSLTTELNSLSNGSISSASSAIDNSSNLDRWVSITLTVATQGGTRSAGATVSVHRVDAVDGTNYDDVEATCAPVIAVFPLDAATTARQCTRIVKVSTPGLFKVFARNNTGQAFASSGNIVEVRFFSDKEA